MISFFVILIRHDLRQFGIDGVLKGKGEDADEDDEGSEAAEDRGLIRGHGQVHAIGQDRLQSAQDRHQGRMESL